MYWFPWVPSWFLLELLEAALKDGISFWDTEGLGKLLICTGSTEEYECLAQAESVRKWQMLKP